MAGRVMVNGQVVQRLGVKVKPQDKIQVDGKTIHKEPLSYVILNKPQGYITTASDPRGRPTVLELVPSSVRLFPVGRLDYDTEGLLLLTNDGELANILTHPRYGVEKTYKATVRGIPDAQDLNRLACGIKLEDGPTQPAKVRLVGKQGDNAIIELTICEGRKRQVRRMCQAIGHSVLGLVRIRFGPLRLGSLPSGSTRELTEHEKKLLALLKQKRKKGELGGHTKGGGGKNDHDQKRR